MHRLGRLVPPTLLSSSPVVGSTWSSGLQHIVIRHEKTYFYFTIKKKKKSIFLRQDLCNPKIYSPSNSIYRRKIFRVIGLCVHQGSYIIHIPWRPDKFDCDQWMCLYFWVLLNQLRSQFWPSCRRLNTSCMHPWFLRTNMAVLGERRNA